MSSKSFESVAEQIRASYGDDYENIFVNQSNEKVNPNSTKVVNYTTEEKEKMFAENYRLIYHVANRYVIRGGIEREELYHSGLLGMVKALNTYDKNMGEAKFSTYAIRVITNEILYFMRRERKHREDHEGNYLHHLEDTLSTDENGRPFEKGDTIEDNTLPDPNSIVYNEELYYAITELMERILDKDEIYILQYRHGLNDTGTVLTQIEIAEILDMSQANVSKLQRGAEDRLYRYLVGVAGNERLTIEEAREKLGGLSNRRKNALERLQEKQISKEKELDGGM